jgi:hypothetical protein
MAPRYDVVADALRDYRPGALTDEYQSMDNRTRQEIADKADQFLSLATGFHGDLDVDKPGHRSLVRQWALIRDALVACHVYDMRMSEIQGAAARLEAEISDLRSSLPRTECETALPPALPHGLSGKLLAVRRIIAECSHVSELMEAVAPFMAAGRGAAAMMNARTIGLTELIFLAAAMDEIGEAREIGSDQAERHAFLHGFASYLVHGRIINSIGAGHKLGQRQLQGEEAAKKMVSRLPAHLREDFLKTYRAQPQRYPSENMDRALHDLGFRW